MKTLFQWYVTVCLVAIQGGCYDLPKLCTDHSDCPEIDGEKKLFCTKDNLCAEGTPLDGLCREQYPPSPPEDSIVIGALLNRDYGNDTVLLKSYKLALDEINQNRHRPDPPFMLQICEISWTPQDPRKTMQFLARDKHAVAVLGPTTSREYIEVKSEVIASRVPVMSPGATSPEISKLGGDSGPIDGLFFRVAPSDILQGPRLADLVKSRHEPTRELRAFWVDEAYGNGLSTEVLAELDKSLIKPSVMVRYTEPSGGANTEEITTKVNELLGPSRLPDGQKIDILAIPNRYAAAVLDSMMRHVNKDRIQHISIGEGGKNQAVLNKLAMPIYPLADKLIGTAPSVTYDAAYKKFETAFHLKWPNDLAPDTTAFTAYAYDALYAVAIAIGAAEYPVTPQKVSEMLLRLRGCPEDGNRKVIQVGPDDYESAVRNLQQTQGKIVLQGLSGEICFDSHGDRQGGLYERWKPGRDANENWIFERVPIP